MRGSFLTDGETECFRSDVALHCFGRDFTIRFNLIFGFLDVLKSHLADFPVNFSFSYISHSLIFPILLYFPLSQRCNCSIMQGEFFLIHK